MAEGSDASGPGAPGAAAAPRTRRSWRELLPTPREPLPAHERPAGAATRMGAATLASRVIGFVRVWMITTVLGTTYLGNSYQATNSVSNVIFELIAAGALSAVLVPTFVELLDAGDQKAAEDLAAGLMGLAAAVLGVIAAVGMVASPWLASVLSTGAPAGPIADQQQALSTFFLLFFIPQVVFYVFGTVTEGVLFAQRRFVVTALAPIANTIVIVVVLGVFHVMHPGTGLDLTLTEKLWLSIGTTIGVLAFCAVPVVAVARGGFRVRARLRRPDARLRRMLGLSTWAVLQHMGIGVLLLASIVMGNQVEGGVVAYQFAFVAFMAPYAILAQPVHTTILPSLAIDAASGALDVFTLRVRWAVESLALLTFPVSAALVALALPAMEVLSVGKHSNGELLAASLASLSLGLFPYSVFLLFARAFYALGNSRIPAIVALVTAVAGALVMVVGATAFSGAAVVAALGIGNTVAYVLGALVLGVMLSRRLGRAAADAPAPEGGTRPAPHRSLVPVASWRPFVLSIVVGAVIWVAERAIQPDGRVVTILVLVALCGLGALAYAGLLRLLAGPPVPPTPPGAAPASTEAQIAARDGDLMAVVYDADLGDEL